MQQTIASTTGWPDRKISAPYARALITRARLTDPLTDAARAGRVVLIVAPGGTGKTSLLADWTRQAPLPVAWYSLDAADRDTRRLVSGILAAVERALPGTTGAPARMLEQGAAEMATMGMLLSALERHPLTLVLDDFQHLDDASDVAALWDHFFRFRPPSLSLVILSRTVPLLGFAALAAMDALVGLGLTDLSFDAEEAARLLEAHGLDATASPLLVRRSGGWATGMLLLARAGPDGIRQLRARQDAMMEHLGGEMLGALPPRVRTFLLESAVLGPVSPAEANGILQRRDSAMLFADLAARSLFLDRQNGTYRYHDLFAEYLIGVLAARAPARLHAIRSSAAVWWETHEDIPRALALLTDDEDWPALAAMLERTRAELWSRRLWGTISSYVERLPPAFRSVRLLELCGYAYCERGEFAPALAMVDAAMAIAGSDQEWLRPALLATQTLVLAGRYEEGIRSAEAGLEVAMRTGHSTAVSRLRRWRGGARLRLGHPEGRDDLLAALAVHRQMGDSEGEALVLAQLAAQLIESGQLGDVEDLLARAGVLWRRQSYNIGIATLHASWARYHALRGNLAQAREEAALSLALLEHDPHPMSQCDAILTLAEICADAGDLGEADQRANEAMDLSARLDIADLLNAALRVRIAVALARRDRAGARRLIDEARTLAVTPVDSALLDYLEGVYALRVRAFARAVDRLSQSAKALEAVHRLHHAARAYLLLGEAALGNGVQRRAETALNRMAELTGMLDCEGYLRAPARMARQVFAERHLLRGLQKRARVLLDRLAGAVPALTVLQPADQDTDAAQPHRTLHVSPFGQGAVVLANRAVEPHALPPKARELLFYAVRMARPLLRAELLETLWGDEHGAAPNLWDASRHLRRLLGEHSWVNSGGRYALHLDIQDDGHEFDQMASAALGKGSTYERLAAAERALELLGSGGYLEWCDSLWATSERTRAMTRAMAVALVLVRLYDEMGRCQEAIAICRRALGFDPYDEAPRLALLRLLVADGQVETAIQEYNVYRQLLHEELAAEPSMAVCTVVAKLKRCR